VKVLIADDEPMARERLRALLAEQPGLDLVAEAGDGDGALAACHEHQPDIVLLDIPASTVWKRRDDSRCWNRARR
jgi:two-component system response regulator AlgR